MLLALGAVSSAVDALQSLTSPKSSKHTPGFSQNAAGPFNVSNSSAASANPSPATGGNGSAQISPETMSALLAAQDQSSTATGSATTSRSAALTDLFSQVDANSDGKINKSEFENALGAGGTNVAQADHVFGELDRNGDGSVSLGELASALKGGNGHHHSHHASDSEGSSDSSGSSSADSSSDPLLQA